MLFLSFSVIDDMLETVKTLSVQSTERQCKINEMAEDVQCMKKDYVGLKQRAELLIKSSSADSDPDSATCASHAEDTTQTLTNIQNCTEFTKQCLEEVEGFSHPCGGPGWRLALYLDTSVPGTQCPNGWDNSGGDCTTLFSDCSTAVVPISQPYNQVCGRVHAHGLEGTGAFGPYYNGPANGDPTIGVDEYFANGVIITRGSDEHVFSFIAGSPPLLFGSNTPTEDRCPCLQGEDNFFLTHDPLPDFLDGDYFCETSTPDVDLSQQVSLWDGLNCPTGSECCDHGPYFTKVLPTATNEQLQLRLCEGSQAGSFAVHLVEIYVK